MEVSAPQFMIGFKGDAPGRGDSLRQRLLAAVPTDRSCQLRENPYGSCFKKRRKHGPGQAGHIRKPVKKSKNRRKKRKRR